MSEMWKPVVGYEGLYEVSDLGRVRSLDRLTPTRWPDRTQVRRGRALKPSPIPMGGHLRVKLYRSHEDKVTVFVHRLVLEAFVGPCPDGMECCHNDGDPTNNHVGNLRWDTKSANTIDRVKHGTHNSARKTHCKKGHPFTPDNTYIRPDRPAGRICRTCLADNTRRYRLQKSARPAIKVAA